MSITTDIPNEPLFQGVRWVEMQRKERIIALERRLKLPGSIAR